MKTKSSIRDNRGSALVIALVVTVVIAGMAGAFISLSLAQNRGTQNSESRESALGLAESGLDYVVYRMTNWGTNSTPLVEATNVTMGGGTYQFTIDPDFAGVAGQYTVVSTGAIGGTRRRIEAVVAPIMVRLFDNGGYGRTRVSVEGNAGSDSFNSSLGTYESQATNGSGVSRHALENGNIASDGDISLDSNAFIWGNVTPGPGGTVTGAGGRVSGTTTPAEGPKILPPIVLPPIATSPGTALNYNGNGAHTIAPGDYHFSSLSANSNVKVTIKGPATIVADSFEFNSNTQLNIDASGGPVKLFVTGKFVIDSNVVVNNMTKNPEDLEIQITTNNQSGSPEVTFDSNSKLYGTIYAPNTNITLDSNGELFGAIIANDLTLASNFRIHYDEKISKTVPGPYRARNWRELVPN